MRILAVVSAVAMTLFPVTAFAAFIPSTLFTETIVPYVSYEPGSRKFTYSYTVANAPSSQQSIANFGIGYKSGGLGPIASPPHWTAFPDFSDVTMVYWYARGRFEWSIRPGSSLGGFSFTHTGLPSIRTYFSQSSYIYSPENQEEIDKIESEELNDYFNNCKRGKTVGPGPTPAGGPSGHIANMVQLKHQAQDLGWISSSGIVTSLDAKLEAAQAAIDRGQNKTASNQIQAFEHELVAQKGKTVNQSAYIMLRANADYLLDLLRSSPR